MHILFPCARGEQALGHAEVKANASHTARLPKAFCVRNVSMVWELLRQEGLVDEDCPSLHWTASPAPGIDKAALMRGGSSANLASLLAALRYAQPLDHDVLGHPARLWASGELNPSSDTAFLYPVGEIETKICAFLEHCREHGPALFLAPIGNESEISHLRETQGERFDEFRQGAGFPALGQLRKPTILWLGCTQEQFCAFVTWAVGGKRRKAPVSARGRRLVTALAATSLLLMSCLGFALVSNQQWQDTATRAERQKRLALQERVQAHQALQRVQHLLQNFMQTVTQKERQDETFKREHKRLWRHIRRAERRLRLLKKGPKRRSTERQLSLQLRRLHQQVKHLVHKTQPPRPRLLPANIRPPALRPLSPLCKGIIPRKRPMMKPVLSRQLRLGSSSVRHIHARMRAHFTGKGQQLLLAFHKTLQLRAVPSLKARATKHEHKSPITSLAVSPDGKHALTTSRDHTARIWRLPSGQPQAVLKGHKDSVLGAAYLSPHMILTAGEDRTIRRWDAHSGKLLTTRRLNWSWATTATFSPGGTLLVTTHLGAAADVWSPISGQFLYQLKGHKERINAVRFSHDSKFIATISLDNTIRLWDARNGKPLGKPLSHNGYAIYAASFSRDNTVLATASGEAIRFWDICKGKTLMITPHRTGPLHFLSFSPSGRFLLAGLSKGRLRLYHAP